MSKLIMWFLLAALMPAMICPAEAKTVGVGGCNPTIKNYPNISAAVGDPANASATIQVCAAAGPGSGGSYPEQVTISQPLTLEGVANGNSGRTVISVPTGPLSTNVASIIGQSLFAQVLVQAGPVNITGITVDGTGGNIGCSGTAGLVGIFYASGSRGTIKEATARNQMSSGCGTGIWVENGSATGQLITIENSSVENMDEQGIAAFSNQQPPTLQVTIQGNSVTASTLPPTAGILADHVSGKIEANVVTPGVYGIESILSSTEVLSNVVADIRNSGSGEAFYLTGSATAQNNNVSDADTAFYLGPGQEAGPTLKGNASMNNNISVEFSCDTNATVESNRLTDSQNGFNDWPGTAGKNQFYDIDTIPTVNQCP
jgi:Periplasmic copper-binding protein (NosD)